MFVIQVDKSKLTIIESEILVSDAINVYPIRFNFSDDWSNLSKVAIFYNDHYDNPTHYSVLLGSSDTIFIPSEVLTDVGGTVYVGICGEGGATQHLPTLIISLGQVKQGICGPSTEVSNPTPSIYQQILSELAFIRLAIESGMLKGDPGPRGPKGEQGLKGEKGDKGDPGSIVDSLIVDPATLIYEDGILSIRQEIIVRGVDLEMWEQMTEEDKRGLIFVTLSQEGG